MALTRRQTMTYLGGSGAVAIGGVGMWRITTESASAQAFLTVRGDEVVTEDGTIEDVLLTDGRGMVTWDNIEPTLLDFWLGAEPDGYDGAWGWDPHVTEDRIPAGNTFEFTFDDLFTAPLTLSDSVGGSIDLSIFEPAPDEDERSVPLQFTFRVIVVGDSETVSAEAEDTAVITVGRAENGEPSASITDTEFELTIET